MSATEVNQALYGDELRFIVVQDRDFRWYVREPYRRMEEHRAALLSRPPVPLTAKELSRQLADLFGEAIDTSVINGFLYGDRMRGLVAKNDLRSVLPVPRREWLFVDKVTEQFTATELDGALRDPVQLSVEVRRAVRITDVETLVGNGIRNTVRRNRLPRPKPPGRAGKCFAYRLAEIESGRQVFQGT